MRARGGGKVQLLLALALTAGLIFAAFRIVPVFISSYEFEDAMRSQAKYAGVQLKSAEVIREELYKKAQDLELPIRREQIRVVPRADGVQIAVRYSVPVNLYFYTHDFSFDYTADTRTAY